MTRPHAHTIVGRFLDAVAACPSERRRAKADVPREMWESEPDADGWIRWKVVPSTASDADLAGVERELGHSFPPSYRELLTTAHFGVLDLGVGLRIRPHLPGSWRRELLALRDVMLAMPGSGKATDLLPFGTNLRPENGLVCFDTSRRAENGDCPVVLLTEGGSLRGARRWTIFGSAHAMFDRLIYLLEQDWRPPEVAGHAGSLRAEIKAAAESYLGADGNVAARAAAHAVPAARRLFRLRGISLAKTGSA